jgi:hypothetical protein
VARRPNAIGHRTPTITKRELLDLNATNLPLLQPDAEARYPVPTDVSLVQTPPKSATEQVTAVCAEGPWLYGPWLRYSYTARRGAKESPPARRCLREFMRLHDVEPEEIRRFAATRGVLGICRHLMPSSHDRRCRPIGVPIDQPVWEDAAADAYEPLETWRELASEAYGVISAAARLQVRAPAEEEDWIRIEPWVPPKAMAEAITQRREDPERVARTIANRVSGWLERASLVPSVRWYSTVGGAGFALTLEPPRQLPLVYETYGYLFPLLASQLAAVVGSRLVRCAECHDVWPKDADAPRPMAGRNQFCSWDCQGEAERRQKRESYAANKDAWPSQAKRRRAAPQHAQTSVSNEVSNRN